MLSIRVPIQANSEAEAEDIAIQNGENGEYTTEFNDQINKGLCGIDWYTEIIPQN